MDTQNINLRPDGDGVIVPVKVVPGASRNTVAGALGDCVKITTAAPAEKGKANAAVARTLAKTLGLPARDVALVSGPSSPRKEFRVAGVTMRFVQGRLANA